jgi:purine-binding chemotaxis protein CheW
MSGAPSAVRDAGTVDVVVFTLGGHRFGVPAYLVHRLLRAVAITKVPRAPAILEGIIDVRGRIVPVLDVRRRFGLEAKAVALSDHLILADAGGRLVALRADAATDLLRVPAAAIEAASVAVPEAPYIAGIAKLEEGIVLIYDLPRFLDAPEAAAIDDALERAGHAER